MNKRILVTGASSFIGRHVIARLAGSGNTVFATFYSSNDIPRHREVNWAHLDITDAEMVDAVVSEFRPQIVFNFAARNGRARCGPDVEHFVNANFNGTYNLLKGLSKVLPNLERVILMGAWQEYGRTCHLPVTEDYRTHPVSPFSASKSAATNLARVYYQLFGLPVVILRPFKVYGPGQSPRRVLPELIHAACSELNFAMTAGRQTRDFVYIDDVVEGILEAAVRNDAIGETINLSTGQERTIRAVAENVIRRLDSKTRLLFGAIPYRADEVWRSAGNNAKAKRLLEWAPKVTFDEGLERTIAWYLHCTHEARSA